MFSHLNTRWDAALLHCCWEMGFFGKSLIRIFSFRLCAAFWWGIWKSCADFAAGFGLLPAPDSDIRISLMLINATTQGINSVLGKAVNYPQIKQRKKGNQCGEKWQPILGFPLHILPNTLFWKKQPQEHLLGSPQGFRFSLEREGILPCPWRELQVLGQGWMASSSFYPQGNGSRAFPGRFSFSQGGGGIQAWINNQHWQMQPQSHDEEFRAWNSHCFEIPIPLKFPLLWNSHCFEIPITLKFPLLWDSHCKREPVQGGYKSRGSLPCASVSHGMQCHHIPL